MSNNFFTSFIKSLYFIILYVGFESLHSLIHPTSSSLIIKTNPQFVGVDNMQIQFFNKHSYTKTEAVKIKKITNTEPYRSNRISRDAWRTASASKPLYKVFQPFIISETVSSESWEVSEAVVEFKINICTLKNILRAKLNITLKTTGSGLNLPLTLLGSAASSDSGPGSVPISSIVTLGYLSPHSQDNRLSFNVLSFLNNVTTEYKRHCSVLQRSPARHLVRVVFKIRRECNTENGLDCQPILDIATRIPFLKVDFTNQLNDSDDDSSIEDLLMLTRQQRLLI